MLGYLQMQRKSEGYAARVFEELYSNATARRAAARFLADAIKKAQTVSQSWSVTLDRDSIRLNVGPVRTMCLVSDSVWFCAEGAKRSTRPRWLKDVSKGAIVYPKSVKIPSRGYQIDATSLRALPADVRAAALTYVEKAAALRQGRSLWSKAHSPGVIRFLSAYLRMPLEEGTLPESTIVQLPDEMPTEREFYEGAVTRVSVNAYERNREARDACVRRFGTTCSVCGFDFGATYGKFAEGFIHVHHTKAISEVGRRYRVDPSNDLRPVCPNCHAAIHIGGECRGVAELKRVVKARRR